MNLVVNLYIVLHSKSSDFFLDIEKSYILNEVEARPFFNGQFLNFHINNIEGEIYQNVLFVITYF